ncbi:MAG TPA: zinc-binding alcohol dehydrogenase family protein [Tepidisphaeraceae bacterium]
MKAWLLDDLTGIERMRIGDVAEPSAGAGEIVIELEYAGLNPADRYLAKGEYPGKPKMPHVLGRDGVGIVVSVGAGVRDYSVGQRILILRGETGVSRWGTFAERVAVCTESIALPPAGWTVRESAGASLVYLTAYQALTQWGELSPGVVLITGASGGVGVAAVQLGKALGHTIVALSRSEEKQAKLRELGADYAIDPSDAGWPAKLKTVLGTRRVDLAIDNIGGAMLSQVMETLGNWGKVSAVGRLAGPVPQFNTASLFFRRIRIGGVAVGAYLPAEARAAWDAVVGLLGKSGDRPIVDRVFPFDQLLKAFDSLAAGPMGKVLVEIGKPSDK